MKRDRFIMNVRFLTRSPKKYKIIEFSWNSYITGGPSFAQVENTPVRPYSYLKRHRYYVGFEKAVKGYRRREYKFFPRVNSYYDGCYKNVYKKPGKNPLVCRNSF
jgi:hypothetical protein